MQPRPHLRNSAHLETRAVHVSIRYDFDLTSFRSSAIRISVRPVTDATPTTTPGPAGRPLDVSTAGRRRRTIPAGCNAPIAWGLTLPTTHSVQLAQSGQGEALPNSPKPHSRKFGRQDEWHSERLTHQPRKATPPKHQKGIKPRDDYNHPGQRRQRVSSTRHTPLAQGRL